METPELLNIIVATSIITLLGVQLILILVLVRSLLSIKRTILHLKLVAEESHDLVKSLTSDMKQSVSWVAAFKWLVRQVRRRARRSAKE